MTKTHSQTTCADKLFLNIDYKKSSKEIYKQLIKDTNYTVFTTYKQYKKRKEGIRAKYKRHSDIYPGADSIYVSVGWGWYHNMKISKTGLTKGLTITAYLKDEQSRDRLFSDLKNIVCKDIDFNNQKGLIEDNRVFEGAGDIFLLSDYFYPYVLFDKVFYQNKYSVSVEYADFE